MKLGLLLWNQDATWTEVVDAARRADRLGYDSVWMWDHLYSIAGDGVDPYRPIFEGWTSISALAAMTEHVRLGLLVGANGFRNPGLVAKMAATLDHISDGRAIVGLGAGWFEIEHTAHGIPFGASVGERLDWLDQSARIIRGLLDGETVTHRSEKYDFVDARHAPRPIRPTCRSSSAATGCERRSGPWRRTPTCGTRWARSRTSRTARRSCASIAWPSAGTRRRSSGRSSSSRSSATIRRKRNGSGRSAVAAGTVPEVIRNAWLGSPPTSPSESGPIASWASTRYRGAARAV